MQNSSILKPRHVHLVTCPVSLMYGERPQCSRILCSKLNVMATISLCQLELADNYWTWSIILEEASYFSTGKRTHRWNLPSEHHHVCKQCRGASSACWNLASTQRFIVKCVLLLDQYPQPCHSDPSPPTAIGNSLITLVAVRNSSCKIPCMLQHKRIGNCYNRSTVIEVLTSRDRANSMACKASPFSMCWNSISGATMPINLTLPPRMFCKHYS